MRFAGSGPLPICRVRPGLDPQAPGRPAAVQGELLALLPRLLLSRAAARVAEPGGPWLRRLGPCPAVQVSSWLGEDTVLPSGVLWAPARRCWSQCHRAAQQVT